MKLRCEDDIVRDFIIASYSSVFREWNDSECTHCGQLFGCHDTKILKPEWKKHCCGEAKKDGE